MVRVERGVIKATEAREVRGSEVPPAQSPAPNAAGEP